jgi:hypothetical protein
MIKRKPAMVWPALCIVFVILSAFLFRDLIHKDRDELAVELKEQFEEDKELLMSVVAEGDLKTWKIIRSTDSVYPNEHYSMLFEKLGYRTILFDGHGNVYFDRYGDGLHFLGLLFTVRITDVLVPDSEILENLGQGWYVFYENYL